MKKKQKDVEYVRPRGNYVVNQKSQKFGDSRLKRLGTRGAVERQEIRLGS